jgi:hypothetical protein
VNDPTELTKHAPDFLGSLTAMFLLKNTWPRRIALFIAGMGAAYYGSPYVAGHTGADPSLSGYLTGLFSMAIVAKIFESIEALQPQDLINRILQRLGL